MLANARSDPDHFSEDVFEMSLHSLEQLYHTYFKQMVLFANKYLHDLDKAQDVTQDVFVDLIRKNVQPGTNPKSYFFTAIRYKCLDYLKVQKLRNDHHESMAHVSSHSYFENSIEDTELENYLMQQIDLLPTQRKKVFYMSRISGKSNDQIAKELNLSKRTVETQISKALKTLRDKIGQFQHMLWMLL